jgi:hypothetical protein
VERGVEVTESEEMAKAREFVDSIIKVNKQHGVSASARAIRYDTAVKAAARTHRRLRKVYAAAKTKSA